MPRKAGINKEKSDETKEKIVALYRRKPRPSLEEIGQQFGVSRQYVSMVIQKAEIASEEAEETDVAELLEKIFRLTDWSHAKLATVLGVAREAVTRWANGQKASTTNARRLFILAEGIENALNKK